MADLNPYGEGTIDPATLERMARSIRVHLSREDALLIAKCCLEHTDRFQAYVNVEAGSRMREDEWAHFALRCAKRIMAGGPA